MSQTHLDPESSARHVSGNGRCGTPILNPLTFSQVEQIGKQLEAALNPPVNHPIPTLAERVMGQLHPTQWQTTAQIRHSLAVSTPGVTKSEINKILYAALKVGTIQRMDPARDLGDNAPLWLLAPSGE